MKRRNKRILSTVLIFTALIPLASFAHFLIFPQETRSVLIGFSDFKSLGRLYFNRATTKNTIDSIESLIQKASLRVARFKFLSRYCSNVQEVRLSFNHFYFLPMCVSTGVH